MDFIVFYFIVIPSAPTFIDHGHVHIEKGKTKKISK